MKCAEIVEQAPSVVIRRDPVRMPNGLLGFEQYKDYVLVTNPDEHPFAWLQVLDQSGLVFVVVDPFLVMPDYQPDIPQADVDILKLKQADDALVLGIVTIHDARRATVNLKGPVVMNRHLHVGKQVILANAAAYSVTHPLPLAASGE